MFEQYSHINKVTGISLQLLSAGEWEINACSLSVQGKTLDIDKKEIGIDTFEDLKKQFSTKYVALNISGKGILQRTTELIQEINQASFSKIFPNTNLEDFYVQNFQSGNQSFLSIIRRSEADKWLMKLQEVGFVALSMSLGPFAVYQVADQLNIYDQQLLFDGHVVERDSKAEWLSYKYNEEINAPFPIKIESEPIHEKLLTAYAAAFQVIMSDKFDAIEADVSELRETFQKILSKLKLKTRSAILVFSFFILLLINTFILSSLTTSNQHLEDQVSLSTQSSANVETINDQIKQKEDLLNRLGWDGGINKSALIDQIASMLPADLTLENIQINPIDIAHSRVQKTMAFENRKIKITGYAENILPVNEWIARIKTRSWVKNIELANYSYNTEKSTGSFTITISY